MNKILFSVCLILAIQTFTNAYPTTRDWTIIQVRNKGGYVARFEVKYKLNENYVTESTGAFAVGQARSVILPPEATFIIIRTELNVFVNSWSTVFSYNLARAEPRCFEVWGTTLIPYWGETDC